MFEGVAVCFGIIAILAVFYILASVRIFKEYERGVKFRLGKYVGEVGPGLEFVWAIIENAISIELRVRTLDVPRQDVITKDNASVGVDAVIYYKVVDPSKVILKVENFEYATIRLAQTTLRSIIGDMDLDSVLSQREVINTKLRETLDSATGEWGVKIEAVEIKEVEPPRPIQEAMTKQMAAERNKRAVILEAEGSRQAKILEAEGDKEATIKKADGERQSKILRAQGEAEAIRTIADSAKANLKDSAMTLWQLKAFEEVGKSPSTKFIIPMEFTSLAEKISKNLGIKSEK